MTPPKKSDEETVVKTNPDPTEAVKEAMTLLRHELALAIKNLDEKMSQRIDANDKAVELARDEVKNSARDLATSQANALQAALKSTIDANVELKQSFEKTNGTTNEKIDRLTGRIDIWTGRDNSVADNKQDRSTDKGQTLQLVAVLAALSAVVISLIPHFTK